jgi:hypothetical protein
MLGSHHKRISHCRSQFSAVPIQTLPLRVNVENGFTLQLAQPPTVAEDTCSVSGISVSGQHGDGISVMITVRPEI